MFSRPYYQGKEVSFKTNEPKLDDVKKRKKKQRKMG